MKRCFDFFIAIIALFLLSPILIVITLLLLATGEGEIFYFQDRVGENGKVFSLIKFATMLKKSSDMLSGDITVINDPRVLPLGKWLRKTKLNELPQFYNVLRGDMSLVGPRPLSKKIHSYIPSEKLILISHLKPGITGIGSLIFRDEEALISKFPGDYHLFYKNVISPFKADLEIWYSVNRSFLVDLKILVLTIWVVILPNTTIVNKIFPTLPSNKYIDINRSC
jgi:lipopolysaccharide/colanic/teichoic acid biosynthesis glycosyltransferase